MNKAKSTYCPHCASELIDADEISEGVHFDCEQNEIDNRREAEAAASANTQSARRGMTGADR